MARSQANSLLVHYRSDDLVIQEGVQLEGVRIDSDTLDSGIFTGQPFVEGDASHPRLQLVDCLLVARELDHSVCSISGEPDRHRAGPEQSGEGRDHAIQSGIL
jgi:hypothetical protein